MQRSNRHRGTLSRLLVGLTGVFVLVVAIYAVLPLIIAGFLKHRLTAYGFSEVNASSGYPRWSEVRIEFLQFSRRVGNWTYTVQATDAAAHYQLSELIAGRFAAIRLPKVVVERNPAQDIALGERAAMPLGVLLPERWLAKLPTEDLVLDELNMRWQAPSGKVFELRAEGHVKDHQLFLKGMSRFEEHFSLDFSGRISDAGELELAIHKAEQPAQPIFHVTNRLGLTDSGHLTVTGAMQAKLAAIAPLLNPWFGLGDFASGMKGSLQSGWQGTVPTAAATVDALLRKMQLNSEHHWTVKAIRVNEMVNNMEVQLHATAELKHGTIYWQLDDRSRVTGQLNLASLGLGERGEQSIAIDLPHGLSGRLDPGRQALAFRLERGGRIRADPLRLGDILVPETHIEFADSATLSYRPASDQWNAGPLSLALEASPLRWRDSVLANEGITLKIDQLGGVGKSWYGEGKVRARAIKLAVGQHAVPQGELMAKWQLGPKQLEMQGALTTSNGGLVLEANGLHELATGGGYVQFDLNPIVFGESAHTLSRLLEPWPYPIDFSSGHLSAGGRIVWRRSAGPNASNALRVVDEIALKLEDVAGHYGKIGFTGLSANLALADHNALRTRETARLRVTSLDAGIPITQLMATADVAPDPQTGRPVIHVAGLSAELLDGRAHSKPFQWNLAAPKNRFTIELERLALSEIVALEGQKRLQADGRLDGRLPIEVTRETIVLRGGELHARPPGGIIRYRPAESLQTLTGNDPSRFALQALSDLQYEALNVKADSTPAGDLALRVELKGHNPDWQSGRPVHLNVSLQENIPMLLRSLRFADELSESMGRKAREHFQKNH